MFVMYVSTVHGHFEIGRVVVVKNTQNSLLKEEDIKYQVSMGDHNNITMKYSNEDLFELVRHWDSNPMAGGSRLTSDILYHALLVKYLPQYTRLS